MYITLKVKLSDGTLREYQFQKDQSIQIGRAEDNDVVIENLSVSGHHAVIEPVGEGILLRDLRSTNGCFVNGEFINKQWLKNGDVITMGDISVDFVISQPAHGKNKFDTMIIDTEQYREMRAESFISKALGEKKEGGDGQAVLAFLAGGEGKVKISKDTVKIGKHPGSDIVVGGMFMGKTAAVIERRENDYYLGYGGNGWVKPIHNDKQVKNWVKLQEYDIIQIGPVKLQFFMEEE